MTITLYMNSVADSRTNKRNGRLYQRVRTQNILVRMYAGIFDGYSLKLWIFRNL